MYGLILTSAILLATGIFVIASELHRIHKEQEEEEKRNPHLASN